MMKYIYLIKTIFYAIVGIYSYTQKSELFLGWFVLMIIMLSFFIIDSIKEYIDFKLKQ